MATKSAHKSANMRGICTTNHVKQVRKGARASRAPPFVVSVIAVASVVSVSVVCDQVDQVVPAHRVDDIDEAHQIDPVHQVDHKDEFHFHINFYKDISLYKGQKVDRLGVQR